MKEIPLLGSLLLKVRSILFKPSLTGHSERTAKNIFDFLLIYNQVTINNSKPPDIRNLLQFKKVGLLLKRYDGSHYYKNVLPLFQDAEINFLDDVNWDSSDVFFVVGLGVSYQEELLRVFHMKKPCYILEENFLRSIVPVSFLKNNTIPSKFFRPVSYFIDTNGPHFVGSIISSLENSISSDYCPSSEELSLSRRMIGKIIESNLSKYNCQPSNEISLPQNGKEHILVVDQVYNDFSVVASGGDISSFKYMLNQAILENPDCNIIIKTHVDRYSRETYFSRINIPPNVFIYSVDINPLLLLKAVRRVYTYSSTMGFEALLCGKDVLTFGSPVYAGWGLTTDKRSFLGRRNVKRSLEELFWFIYLKNSIYIDPIGEKLISLEDAIDILINLRDEFLNNSINYFNHKT